LFLLFHSIFLIEHKYGDSPFLLKSCHTPLRFFFSISAAQTTTSHHPTCWLDYCWLFLFNVIHANSIKIQLSLSSTLTTTFTCGPFTMSSKPSESLVIEVQDARAAEIKKKQLPCPLPRNEFAQTLLTRLSTILAQEGDEELFEAAKEKLCDEIKKRFLSRDQPKLTKVPSGTIHATPSNKITVTTYDYTWGTTSGTGPNYWKADASTGEMAIGCFTLPTAGETSDYAAGGIGFGFTPPTSGIWSFQPVVNCYCDWGTWCTVTGGATSSAYFLTGVCTYADGKFSTALDYQYEVWSGSVAPSSDPNGPGKTSTLRKVPRPVTSSSIRTSTFSGCGLIFSPARTPQLLRAQGLLTLLSRQ